MFIPYSCHSFSSRIPKTTKAPKTLFRNLVKYLAEFKVRWANKTCHEENAARARFQHRKTRYRGEAGQYLIRIPSEIGGKCKIQSLAPLPPLCPWGRIATSRRDYGHEGGRQRGKSRSGLGVLPQLERRGTRENMLHI